jgi:Protein of unknown function (DUF2730)
VNDLTLALWALNFIWMVGLTVVNFARRPGEDATRAAATASEKIDKLGGRVQGLEAHLEHMPSNDDLTKLDGAVREIRATLAALQESVSSLRATTVLIDQHLRNVQLK